MKLHRKLFWLLVFLLPVQLGRHFWPQSSLLLGLRIDYLSPTIFLTDILIIFILFLWFLEKLKSFKKLYAINLNSQNLPRLFLFLSVFVFLVLTSFLARNQLTAFLKLSKILEFGLLALYIFKNKISLKNIYLPLSLAVLYSSSIAIFQFIKQGSLNGFFWFLGERTFDISTPGIAKAIINGELILRPYATFPHPNSLAGFLLVALILVVPFLKRFSRWLVLSLGLLTIIFTFSRSVWLVLLLLIFVLIAFIKNKKIKITLFVLNSLFIIALFILGYKLSTNEALWQRLQLMQSAILMGKLFPFSGVGLNNFIVYLPEFWPLVGFTYYFQPVHNIYLLFLAELGFLGFILLLWFSFLVFKKVLKIPSLKERGILFLAFFSVLFLGFSDHYWFTLQQNQLLLILLLGLIWSSKTGKSGLSLN